MIGALIWGVMYAHQLQAAPIEIPIPERKPTTPKQVNCLTRVIYHEARGEPVLGQFAVAHVVLNRLESKHYPNTLCEVVYQRKQFTGLSPYLSMKESSNQWDKASMVASLVVSGRIQDITGGSKWYYAHRGVNKINRPVWAYTKKVNTEINNHVFLGDKGEK